MERSRCGYVNVAFQKVLEIEPQASQVEKGSSLFQLDEEVHIARRVILPAGYGPEHTGSDDAALPHDVSHLLPKLSHRWSHTRNLASNGDGAPFHITSPRLPTLASPGERASRRAGRRRRRSGSRHVMRRCPYERIRYAASASPSNSLIRSTLVWRSRSISATEQFPRRTQITLGGAP